jgi:hypothetical protein
VASTTSHLQSIAPGIAGFLERVFRPHQSSGRWTDAGDGQPRLARSIRFLAISTDAEFLAKLNAVAAEQHWILSEAPLLSEAFNVPDFEDFPVVVLDRSACEGTWENSLSALVSAAQGVWWPPRSIEKGPQAMSRDAESNTNARVSAGAGESVVRRFFMSAKAPCVILASQYGDEYLRRKVLRLGGYEVLSKSAPGHVISRVIEFAWYWSQRSAANGKPRLSGLHSASIRYQ